MRYFILSGCVMLGACSTMNYADAPSVVLFRATMASVSELPEHLDNSDPSDVGVWFGVKLNIIDCLIDRFDANFVDVDLKMSSMPKADVLKDIYVFGEKQPDGTIRALRWDYVVGGLCIQRDMAKAYGVEGRIINLRKSGMLKWNSDCAW